MTEKVQNTARDLRRTLRILLVATVVLYLGGIGLGLYTLHVANSNDEALCNLRNNYVAQNVVTRDYLIKHPHGAPGIFSEKQLLQILKDRVSIIKALDNGDRRPPLKDVLDGQN